LEEYWRNFKGANVVVHYFSNIMFLKDYCRDNYPELSKSHSFVENCALAHFNEQGDLRSQVTVFNDYDNVG
jgi:hypothetical protein